MEATSEPIRQLEPFTFWPSYSSALHGYGGLENGPDPFYCFHTPYYDFKPGAVVFKARLVGAKATMGELAMRVHAYRADGSMDAVLVGGLRASLENVEDDQEYTIRVASIPGVLYAFYGRFSEASDLTLNDVVITAQEIIGEDIDTYSSMAVAPTTLPAVNLELPSHLTLLGEPDLNMPLSQPCTPAQLADEVFWSSAPASINAIEDPLDRWRCAFAWQALVTYGMAEPGANGLICTSGPNPLSDLLHDRGALTLDEARDDKAIQYDFLISINALPPFVDSLNFAQDVLRNMARLLRGGIGIFIFDAVIGQPGHTGDRAVLAGRPMPTEQDIQRVALKIIGHSSEIAQIHWPQDRETPGADVATPFGLILRR